MIKQIITGVVILVLALLIFSYITSPPVKSKIISELREIKGDIKDGFTNIELKGKANNPIEESIKEVKSIDIKKKEIEPTPCIVKFFSSFLIIKFFCF